MILKSNAKFGTPVESGTIFTAYINNMTVSIHKIIGLEGWFLNCNQLNIMDRELKSKDLFACVRESRKIMNEKLKEIAYNVEIFCIDEPIKIKR